MRSNTPRRARTSESRKISRFGIQVAAKCGPRDGWISTRMGRPVSRGRPPPLRARLGPIEDRGWAREEFWVFYFGAEAVLQIHHELVQMILADLLDDRLAHFRDRRQLLRFQAHDVV